MGIVYDIGQNMAFEVGALPGNNGALAFGVYAAACVVVARQPGLPVWLGAAAAWAAWLVVALAGHAALVAAGVRS